MCKIQLSIHQTGKIQMAKLNKDEIQVLSFLKKEFINAGRGANELKDSYEGPQIINIGQAINMSQLDLDLAIDSLVKSKHIKTGPMEFVEFENSTPGFVIMPFMVSKKEFASLTVLGYKVEIPTSYPRRHSTTNSIIINGGTFSNNQIASGTDVHQQQKNKVEGPSEQLLELLRQENIPITPQIEKEINQLVEVAEAGDTGNSKNIFSKIFGGIGEKAKTLGWEIVTKLIMQQLQLP